MKTLSIGNRLFLSIVLIFILFAVAFISFQHSREQNYKIKLLNTQLQDYNNHLAETVALRHETDTVNLLKQYIQGHRLPNLRVTIIRTDGSVLFDNAENDFKSMPNHLDREEVIEAVKRGSGYSINRYSGTLNRSYFYSATSFPAMSLVIRSALPYDVRLSELLAADKGYLYFALLIMLLLCFVLRRFTSSLGRNITNLRLFATKADRNEALDTEDLITFSDDELGEIAERIIKIYKRLAYTRKEQDRLKRELTQNIAHELKTPTAGIMGYLETVINNPDMEDSTRMQFLKRSYAQAERLSFLIHDISVLNRMDDFQASAHPFETVNIFRVAARIHSETLMQLTARNMNFTIDIDQDVSVNGDPSLIYSIFRNLTDNSIAYAGEHTTIQLTAKDAGPFYQFTFSDNGIGVEAHHLPRLFERFYRVDKGRSREAGGTGLGLAIVKNAVLVHGGEIRVSNNKGSGLCFVFTLPKAADIKT